MFRYMLKVIPDLSPTAIFAMSPSLMYAKEIREFQCRRWPHQFRLVDNRPHYDDSGDNDHQEPHPKIWLPLLTQRLKRDTRFGQPDRSRHETRHKNAWCSRRNSFAIDVVAFGQTCCGMFGPGRCGYSYFCKIIN